MYSRPRLTSRDTNRTASAAIFTALAKAARANGDKEKSKQYRAMAANLCANNKLSGHRNMLSETDMHRGHSQTSIGELMADVERDRKIS